MTITAEKVDEYIAGSGKTIERWEISVGIGLDDVVSAIPGDFKVYSHLADGAVFVVDITRHF